MNTSESGKENFWENPRKTNYIFQQIQEQTDAADLRDLPSDGFVVWMQSPIVRIRISVCVSLFLANNILWR